MIGDTDLTYADKIHKDSSILFALTIALGAPSVIFNLLEDGFSDASLPLSMEALEALEDRLRIELRILNLFTKVVKF